MEGDLKGNLNEDNKIEIKWKESCVDDEDIQGLWDLWRENQEVRKVNCDSALKMKKGRIAKMKNEGEGWGLWDGRRCLEEVVWWNWTLKRNDKWEDWNVIKTRREFKLVRSSKTVGGSDLRLLNSSSSDKILGKWEGERR